jgi:hypothetical protein
MYQLVKRGPQDLAIGNPALTPFATKLVRTLDGIPLNSGDECVAYFNVIADPQTGSPERIELRRRAEDKVLHELYQVVRGATSELEDLWDAIVLAGAFRRLGWTEEAFIQHHFEVHTTIQLAKQGRDEFEQSRKTIVKKWPQLEDHLTGKSLSYVKAIRMHCTPRTDHQPERDLPTTARIVNNVAVDRMMDSRRGVSKTNELITGDWKNALTAMKTASIPQEVLDGLGLALDEHDLIRRHGLRDPNFKGYSYAESIASTPAKSQRYYAGQGQRSSSVPLISEAPTTPPLRPTFLPRTPSAGLGSLSIQPSIETPSMTGKDWARHRARADVFDVPESSPSESSRQRQLPTLSQPPESHSISDDVDMSDVGRGDAGSPYVQPVPLTARAVSNAPEDNTPEPAQSSSDTTPKRKTPKRRAKKVDTTYRAPSRRKPTTRSSKPARDTPADDGIGEDVGGFSDDDEVEDEEACLCGPGVSKGYIDTMDTAIGCDLKVTMAFVRDMLQRWDFMSEENSAMVCWKHTSAMATIVNFDLEGRDPEASLMCLPSVFRLLAQHRDNLEKAYLLPQVIPWLETDFLPDDPHAGIGPVRYFPRPEMKRFEIDPQVYDLILNQWYGPNDGEATDWIHEGAVSFKTLFSWLYEMQVAEGIWPGSERTIGELIDLEFDMYRHHSRELPFARKSGMLPAMVHSLIQQLILQDPVLYSVMVALRPDHATRLMAFPYHAQCSSEGDNTINRRLDLNLKALVDHGLGRNIVQCVVSFENEQEDDATMIWPGMHKHKEEWLRTLNERGAYHEEANRRVFQMNSHHMNEADKTTFGGFKAKPLSKGGALFFRSSVPHGGSQAKSNRKLVFPWFLEMLKGDKYFELMEAAKPPEVMLAHRNRSSPSTYPTGLANKGFALPLTFSSAPILSGLGALPDALLGRRSYDDAMVASEIQYLFQLDRNEVAHWIHRWRENAVWRFFEAFRAMSWVEARDHYEYDPSRDKSFFRAMAEQRPPNDLPPDEAPVDTSVEDVEEGFIYPEQPQSGSG